MAEQGLHQELAGRLLAWYDVSARELPWRAKPGVVPDPYAVWLSEIMLQQTTVAAVKAYFRKFILTWPSVESLAAAGLDDVLKAWAGLGYYARARNLHACAKAVVAEFGGRFPWREEHLRKLPGIGPYTAAAIAAIAFGGRHAAVDGNVERVLSRLHAIETPLPDSKPQIRALAQALVPEPRAGDFAQAMMDLGATVCTPRTPSCVICPWSENCMAKARGIVAKLPRRRAKAAVPKRYGVAFWVEREDGAVLLRRRPERGLLGGMMEVPSTAWDARHPRLPETQAPIAARWAKLPGVVSHTFTHFHLELAVLKSHYVEAGALPDDGDYRWVAAQELSSEALPTVMRKVVALATTTAPESSRRPRH
jgi:A/G-specific adenine glycosylase